jgi:tetratricopeptide (TPR) repeat protein
LIGFDAERFNHAMALRDAGRVEQALQELVALAGSTPDPEARAALLGNQSTCLMILGRSKEARERNAEALRTAPRTQVLLYLWEQDARLYWHEGQREKALGIFERVHVEHGELLLTVEHRDLAERILSARGMLLAELGRYQEALPLLEQSLNSGSAAIDNEGLLRQLGLSYLQLGRRTDAQRVLERLLREGTRADLVADAHLYLGDAYFHERAYAKAMMEFEWCLAHAQEHKIPTSYLYKWLAVTARALGMNEDAERYGKLAKG